MERLRILIVCLWRFQACVVLGSRYCGLKNFVCRHLAGLLAWVIWHLQVFCLYKTTLARKLRAHTLPYPRGCLSLSSLKPRSRSDRSRNLNLDQLWPYYMVRWVGHVACAREMKGTCRFGSMKGRDHFGDVDFGGSLIQRGTNVECGEMCQDTVKWQATNVVYIWSS